MRLRAEGRRLAGHRDALAGQVADDLFAYGMHEHRRATAPFRLLDGGRRVVDVHDVLGCVRGAPDVVQERGVEHGRVQVAPGLRAVRAHGAGEQVRVGAVEEVEASVARQQERVARAARLREEVERVGQRHRERTDAEGTGFGHRGQGVADRKPVQQPVDGAYPERIAGRVHEQHQAEVPGAGRRLLGAQPKIGRPAVVAVRDHRLVVCEVPLDLREVGGVRDRPQAVVVAVLGGRREQRLAPYGPLDDRARAGRRAAVGARVAVVRQEQRFEVRGRRAHQVGAVLDDVRHHVLVRQHHALGGLREGQRADQPALEQARAAQFLLLVHVQRGHRVGGEDALREPVVEGVRGLLVPCRGRGGLREDQPDDVVRIRRLQVEESVGPYHHVVRRGGHGREAADARGHIAQSSEGDQAQPVVVRTPCCGH